MISINLLDWRSKRIKILNHRFVAVTSISVIITVLLTLSSEIFIQARVNKIKSNMSYMDTQLRAVDDKIQTIKDLQNSKQLLISRRKIIESLQGSRPLYVKLFDSMVRVIPSDITINEISRKGLQLDLSGISHSHSSVATLVDKLQELAWVKDAKIGEIKTSDSKDLEKNPGAANYATTLSFHVNVTIKAPLLGKENATK